MITEKQIQSTDRLKNNKGNDKNKSTADGNGPAVVSFNSLYHKGFFMPNLNLEFNKS